MVPQDSFDIERTDDYVLWAERRGDVVRIHRTDTRPEPRDTFLVELTRDALRNLLVWSDGDSHVTYSIGGPLAQQVREHARELSLPPEMFVWHAVKVFIDVGTS